MRQMPSSANFPQPTERMLGEQRDPDGILSLETAALAVRKALMQANRVLWSAVLVGNQPPTIAAIYARMKAPLIGDLVTEWMVSGRAGETAFGYLIGRREEGWSPNAEYAAEMAEDPSWDGEPRLTDEAWYIQYGPAPDDVARWTNCDFHVVMLERPETQQ